MFFLFNPFITIWLGPKVLFSWDIVLVLCINFYINSSRKTSLIFKDALGLFWNDRFKPLVEAVLGIGMAVGFSFLWGTFGVLLGFALATLLTSYWIEPYVLYKHGFKKNIKEYLFIILKQTLLLIILFGTVFFITYSINIGGWFELLIKNYYLLYCAKFFTIFNIS